MIHGKTSTASLFCSQWLNKWLRDDSYNKEDMRITDLLGESSDLTSLHVLEKERFSRIGIVYS